MVCWNHGLEVGKTRLGYEIHQPKFASETTEERMIDLSPKCPPILSSMGKSSWEVPAVGFRGEFFFEDRVDFMMELRYALEVAQSRCLPDMEVK